MNRHLFEQTKSTRKFSFKNGLAVEKKRGRKVAQIQTTLLKRSAGDVYLFYSMKLRILYTFQNRSVSFQVALTISKICLKRGVGDIKAKIGTELCSQKCN